MRVENLIAGLLEVSKDCEGFLGTYRFINDINTLYKVAVIGPSPRCLLSLLSISGIPLPAFASDINGADERFVHVRVCFEI